MTALSRRDTYIVARVGAAAAIVVALIPVNCTNTDGAAEVGQREAASRASPGDLVEPAPEPKAKPEPKPATIPTEEIDAKITEATNS
jgi:hypothetical protein